MRRVIICRALMALATLCAPQASTTAGAQELNSFQRQVLGGIKKSLVEYLQKQHATCDSTDKEVCDINRVDVLDDVLKDWKDAPDYGRYAVNVMDWQVKLSMTVAEMARNYVARHGHLDVGFESELHRRMAADPAFHPPEEYLCRHLFGTPHLYGSQGPCK